MKRPVRILFPSGRLVPWLAGIVLAVLLSLPFVFPSLDLLVSGLFYVPEQGFVYRNLLIIRVLHESASVGGRLLAFFLLGCFTIALMRRGSFFGLARGAWFFLLLNLVVGVGLVANVGFKDHWGRPRPHDVVAFGGDKPFYAAHSPSRACDTNCSFVCGDGAFGFILPALAFVVARHRRRRVFWSLFALGLCFGMTRVVGGSHFLSDMIAAGVMMMAFMAATSIGVFGWTYTRDVWLAVGSKNTKNDGS